jgi:hypothetical protein
MKASDSYCRAYVQRVITLCLSLPLMLDPWQHVSDCVIVA